MNQQVSQPARHQWRGFLAVLTTKRTGQAVTIVFVSAERDSRLVADKDPLSHITYFERDDVLVVCVSRVGADHVGREHIIEHPHTIIVDRSSPSTVRGIDIQGADGARTQITLHGDQGC
ncbi:MAG: DUF5335 domain-containing protein [Actinobacteria bacterium]|nr:DUF5335 domain-containing protein [Actinomycetota bacterium]